MLFESHAIYFFLKFLHIRFVIPCSAIKYDKPRPVVQLVNVLQRIELGAVRFCRVYRHFPTSTFPPFKKGKKRFMA